MFHAASATITYGPGIGQVTIDVLPDGALLEIFDFYKDDLINRTVQFLTWRWIGMTQVCRRWRNIIFGSPRRLDLRLICTNETPARTSLGIWPPFPLVVYCENMPSAVDEKGLSNVIAALKHSDRISRVHIHNTKGPALEKIVAIMGEPFPTLKVCQISSVDDSVPVFPETFSAGSAPHLKSLGLSGIPFSTSRKFVLSIIHVELLHLLNIPNSGYITPETMVAFLAALPNLKHLSIGFRSPPPRPTIQTNRPPLRRVILPALTVLHFSGVSEYFEDIVARIDTPLLDWLRIAFFLDLIFHIPQLHDFINRTKSPGPRNQAFIVFSNTVIKIMLGSPNRFDLEVKCERLDWQLSSISQIFSEQLTFLSHVEQLELRESFFPQLKKVKPDPDMDSSLWLELFRLFTALQSIYVCELLVPPVAAALQELSEGGTMELLPALQSLSLEGLQPDGPEQKAIQSFVDSRRPSDHPVVIQNWDGYWQLPA